MKALGLVIAACAARERAERLLFARFCGACSRLDLRDAQRALDNAIGALAYDRFMVSQ